MWNEVNSVTVGLLECCRVKTEFYSGKMAEGQHTQPLLRTAIMKETDALSPFLLCEIRI